MPITEQTFRRVAIEDPEGQWELHRGRLREKAPLTCRHNDVTFYLSYLLQDQLDRDVYRLRVNAGRVQRADETYDIPDIAVLPTALTLPLLDRDDLLEAYTDPLPLVVEVWSPSTGGYDVDAKIPEYQARGDFEIWRIHPFERSITAWRRQADSGYEEMLYREGSVSIASLPGVTIDLDLLFSDPFSPPAPEECPWPELP